MQASAIIHIESVHLTCAIAPQQGRKGVLVNELIAAQMRVLQLLQILASACAVFPYVTGELSSEPIQEVRETLRSLIVASQLSEVNNFCNDRSFCRAFCLDPPAAAVALTVSWLRVMFDLNRTK